MSILQVVYHIDPVTDAIGTGFGQLPTHNNMMTLKVDLASNNVDDQRVITGNYYGHSSML